MQKIARVTGFTLVEAVISLVVLLATSLIIQLVVQTSRHVRPQTLSSCANWYLFVAELESPKHQFELLETPDQQIVLLDQVNRKKYWLQENHTIYLRGKKGGYLPLLTDYEPHSLQVRQLDERRVAISAKTADGKRYYANLCFLQNKGQRDAGGYSINEHHDWHHSN